MECGSVHIHQHTHTHTKVIKQRPAGCETQCLNLNLIYGEVKLKSAHFSLFPPQITKSLLFSLWIMSVDSQPIFLTGCTNFQHAAAEMKKKNQKKSTKQVFEQPLIWYNPQQREIFEDCAPKLAAALTARPRSDGLIWHLLLQTESVGPRGRRRSRDGGVIESGSLDLIGKWDETSRAHPHPKFGWASQTIAFLYPELDWRRRPSGAGSRSPVFISTFFRETI